MHKKLTMACMAIAAFAAFVIAPAASASPVLTENGAALAVGASIKATNTGITKFTIPSLGGAVECTHAELKGTVKKNNGTVIAGTIPAGAFGVNYTFSGTHETGDCTSPLGPVRPTLNGELCLETEPNHNVIINGCEGKPVTFILDVTGGPTCRYSVASITGSYITNADATVNVSEQLAKRESEEEFLCPKEGKLDMDFDLTTTDGTTLLIS